MAPAIAIPAWAIGTWVIPIAGALVTVYVTPTLIKKASIRRQFPGEMLPLTVEEIQKKAKQGVRAAKTAWKLLTDGRFKK